MSPDLTLDYFPNHRSPDRFPFSLYHAPIRKGTLDILARESGRDRGPLTVVNVGCGFSHILDEMPASVAYLGCDLDERTIAHCREHFEGRNAQFEPCTPYGVPFPDACADLVISTEVIEHVEDTRRWLSELARVLKPGGALCLSTPNYGGWLLPLIESTLLEWIARRQGFTRRGIHPTPFGAETLADALEAAGFCGIVVKKTPGHLALLASARKAL